MPFFQKPAGLVDVTQKDPVDHESAGILDDDRRLAQTLDQGQCAGERFLAGSYGGNDLDQKHFMDGVKKMQADHLRRILCCLRHFRDGQRRGIGRQDRSRSGRGV